MRLTEGEPVESAKPIHEGRRLLPVGLRGLLMRLIDLLLPSGTVVWRGSPSSNTVYLTFDDGPYPARTEAILRALKAHSVQATFFLLGKSVVENQETVRGALNDGHAIGNHTFSHPMGSQTLFWRTLREIKATDQAISSAAGREVRTVRPPYGKITLPLLIYAAIRKRSIVMWTLDSDDSFTDDPLSLRAVADSVKSGDILLFHDDAEVTVRAIGAVIKILKNKGFRFGLIDELLPGHAELT